MAYALIRVRTNCEQGGSEITALCDSVADLENVGTNWAPGSQAVIADEGLPTYILNASRVWKET